MNDEPIAELDRHVATIEAAIRRARHAQDASELYAAELDHAASRIIRIVDSRQQHPTWVSGLVAGLSSFARLHYARYRVGPGEEARYLWSAVRTFGLLRQARSLPARIPPDIIRILDLLAADDPHAVPGLEDPYLAAATAQDMARYAAQAEDGKAVAAAEALARRALDGLAAADPDRPAVKGALAGILALRARLTGADPDPEIAALVAETAAADDRDPRWPMWVAATASACLPVALHARDLRLLDRLVELLGRAVARMPGEKTLLQVLGAAELSAWELRDAPGDVPALDRAIASFTAADHGPPAPGLPDYGEALAQALWSRWERARDIGDIDRVIARLAGRAAEPDCPPAALNLLARSLRARWERTGDSAAIRHAIVCLTRAVEESGAAPETAMYRNNLAAMWLRLHEATDDPRALHHAVEQASRALAECTADDPARPMYANTAAIALLARWEHTEADLDLLRAVNLGRVAATAGPGSGLDRAGHLANLGAAMMVNAHHFGDAGLLDEAVTVLRDAVRIADPAHPSRGAILLNLGQALLTRGDPDDVAEGRDLLRRSTDSPHPRAEDAIRAARLWAGHAAGTGNWAAAAAALAGAVDRLAGLPAHRLDRGDHERLLVRLAGLATDAAAACLNSDAVARAVACLEGGRGVLLATTLQDDRTLARLRNQDEALADRVTGVRALITGGPR